MISKTSIRIIYLLICLIGNGIIHAQTDEYLLKAGFLERFTRFIEWPGETNIADNTKPLVISVIGKNKFDEKLYQFFETTKIKYRKVEIRYISELEEIQDSHILFITKSKEKQLSGILFLTQDKPVLTVSDTDGFGKKGVRINFYIEQNKIRFEINKKAIQKSGLQISYLLLNLAKII